MRSTGPGATPEFRSGFVALVGRPNVGKSTLLNQLVGTKVSIISKHPQTTRAETRGVRTTATNQVVFLDTPGLHRPRTPLGERTNSRALATLDEVDVVCQLVDATAPVGTGDRFVATAVAATETPAILVVNKVDVAGRDEIARQLTTGSTLGHFDAFVPVSATTGAGLDALMEEIEARLPEGPRYYPDHMVRDQPEAALAAELVREKLLAVARDELPHSIMVSVEELDDVHDPPAEGGDPEGSPEAALGAVLRLRATIFVERDSQKGIVIGRGGVVLRDAGTAARRELEALLSRRVFLETVVKVEPNWQRTPASLDRFGF